MSSNLNLPKDYFYKLLIKASEISPIMEIRTESLFTLAEHYIDRNHLTDGRIALQKLHEQYPNSKYVMKGQVKGLLASINTIPDYLAPDLNVQLTTGQKYDLSQSKGKFVLIEFWATSCAVCVANIPNLIDLSNKISTDSLLVIGIANDDSTRLANFMKEQKLNYSNAISDKKLLDEWGIFAFPTTFLIDPEGKIYKREISIGNQIVNDIQEAMKSYYKNNDV